MQVELLLVSVHLLLKRSNAMHDHSGRIMVDFYYISVALFKCALTKFYQYKFQLLRYYPRRRTLSVALTLTPFLRYATTASSAPSLAASRSGCSHMASCVHTKARCVVLGVRCEMCDV